MHAIATRTDTYTVQPFAKIPVDGDAGDLLDRILSALERDPRALGPVVGYDYERQRVDAIFQVQDEVGVGLDAVLAAVGACAIFDDALKHAGLTEGAEWISRTIGADVRTIGVSIVEGDDPDQLP